MKKETMEKLKKYAKKHGPQIIAAASLMAAFIELAKRCRKKRRKKWRPWPRKRRKKYLRFCVGGRK